MVRGCALLVAIMLLCICMPPPANAFDFRVNDFYGVADHSNLVVQYSPSGAIRSSLAVELPQYSYVKGLAFGPDRLLYAAIAQPSGFSVRALDSNGTVRWSYSHSAYIAGGVAYGKISFDNSGHFYVGTGSGLVRFDQAVPPSGSLIYNGGPGVEDVLTLPNGNLLVATDYDVYEMTGEGQVVREISPSDPYHFFTGTTPIFSGIMGIQYDPGSNSLFVTALGRDKIMKLDASSGTLLNHRTFPGGNDMVMSRDGNLVVGNWLYNARIYSPDMLLLGTFGGTSSFVTQFVPETSSVIALLCGLSSLLVYRRRR